MSKYWIQTQAPAGNWVDHLGTDKRTDAEKYLREYQKDARDDKRYRLILRRDVVLLDETGQTALLDLSVKTK